MKCNYPIWSPICSFHYNGICTRNHNYECPALMQKPMTNLNHGEMAQIAEERRNTMNDKSEFYDKDILLNYDKTEKYILLPFSEYTKLHNLASARSKGMVKVVLEDMLFLGAVMERLARHGNPTLFIGGDTVHIKVEYPRGNVAETTFSLDLCKQYYDKIDKFLTEVF